MSNCRGWAVESRVYAEDPYRNFAPSIGRLVRYRPPAEGEHDGVTVRNDTGVFEGGEISLYYDPMIAKLVTHAKTRAAAIEAQSDALDAFTIEGIRHNIPFLAAIMQHPRWRKGELSTAFIAEEFPHGFERTTPTGAMARIIACVAAAIDHMLGERKRAFRASSNMASPASGGAPFRSVARSCTPTLPMTARPSRFCSRTAIATFCRRIGTRHAGMGWNARRQAHCHARAHGPEWL